LQRVQRNVNIDGNERVHEGEEGNFICMPEEDPVTDLCTWSD